MQPSLTTLRVFKEKLGRQAVETLCRYDQERRHHAGYQACPWNSRCVNPAAPRLFRARHPSQQSMT
jgi:hypothetical protein